MAMTSAADLTAWNLGGTGEYTFVVKLVGPSGGMQDVVEAAFLQARPLLQDVLADAMAGLGRAVGGGNRGAAGGGRLRDWNSLEAKVDKALELLRVPIESIKPEPRVDSMETKLDRVLAMLSQSRVSEKGEVQVLMAINEAEQSGDTACFIAAQEGHVQALRALFVARADINKAKQNGATPCYIAARNGQNDALRELIKARADVDKAMPHGSTPCFIASQFGRVEALKLLVEARADVDRARQGGWNPLKVAEALSHDGAAEVLRRAGATKDTVPP